ncbi:MAG: penicillin-binding protein 2 [Candidatus Paceibacterota bacterium]|jgi:cell division protein FtsI (penicillin-binding protein 3)/stage V sporulation protein D (sporulation-specific penicillin-binding protein)
MISNNSKTSNGARNSKISNVWFINTGVLLIALLLISRLGYLQIVKGEYYRNKAESPYLTSTLGTFDRGTIYFTEKSGRTISAATVVPDYTLAIDPTKVGSKGALVDKLLTFVTFDRADLLTRLGRLNDQYEEVAKHLSEAQVAGIKALGDKSIILEKDKKRFYPGGQLASQVLGFVGSNGSTITGRYGLERYYDETLAREGDGGSSSFFADLFLKSGAAILSDSAREGDIVTTIEPSVQGFLERVIEQDILKKFNAASASGIVMDPKTGEIIAMATAPSFDPNNFSKARNQAVFVNPMVEGVYEMGSIVKPLTVAAGLDAGVITAGTTYDDTGTTVINRSRISNYDGKARGVVPTQEILNQSLNMGAIFVMNRLGKDKFRNYFEAFGLGTETGIDLPNEAVGDIHNLKSPRDVEYATASFGQGISMTPIETIRALAVLANGGVLVTPHVVKSTHYSIGPSRDYVAGSEPRVLKPETSREISRMLTVVVDKALMGGTLKMEHYSIAAKTGTAQLVEDGGYSKTDYLHTFFGYFPSTNPRYIVFLAVKSPQGEAYASHTLSNPFMQIAKYLINYYEIPPDR